MTILAVVIGVLVGASAAAAVGHRVGHDQPRFARGSAEYWTPARMKQAEPLEAQLPASEAPSDPAAALSPTPGATGAGFDAANSIAPQLPAASSSASPRIKAPPYIAGPVPLQYYRVFPYSANGRLFFTYRGKSFVCSASSIASKSRSTVLTAGHCVHDKKLGWARNVVFVPAYWAGYAPLGIWPAKRSFAPRDWIRKEHFASDFAGLKVYRVNNRSLGGVAGGIGLAWGQPRRQQYQAVGYPSNLYAGEAMSMCLSRSAGKDPFSRGPGPADTGIGCNMSHGASGGAWMIQSRNKGERRPFVNSVTSYGYNSRPNLLFGPYFTTRVRNLMRATSRG